MNYNGFSASGTKCIQQAIVFLHFFLLGRRIHLFHRRYSALIMTPVVVHARRDPLCLGACNSIGVRNFDVRSAAVLVLVRHACSLCAHRTIEKALDF